MMAAASGDMSPPTSPKSSPSLARLSSSLRRRLNQPTMATRFSLVGRTSWGTVSDLNTTMVPAAGGTSTYSGDDDEVDDDDDDDDDDDNDDDQNDEEDDGNDDGD